ncbi:MAG: isoprenylcysteine carboxylmethyltransferase family protein [Anaerolineae bacterium]|nr:MAG: isoprenylcysteine carboxylmethyltransferase family protein [Anaerolineae bacterium]
MTTNVPHTSRAEFKLLVRGFLRILAFLFVTAAVLFASAGTTDWPAVWIFLGMFLIYYLLLYLWVGNRNPQVLVTRAGSTRADAQGWDRAILILYALMQIVMYVLAGLEVMRYGWTALPPIWRGLGFGLLSLSFMIPFWAMLHNPFAAPIVRIQSESGHRVISSGPYALIRHPMYIAAFLYGLGGPLFFGSLLALLPGLVICFLFLLRTAREDSFLLAQLPGYADYAAKVRFRLFPGIW